jgi:hypothetical protein
MVNFYNSISLYFSSFFFQLSKSPLRLFATATTDSWKIRQHQLLYMEWFIVMHKKIWLKTGVYNIPFIQHNLMQLQITWCTRSFSQD